MTLAVPPDRIRLALTGDSARVIDKDEYTAFGEVVGEENDRSSPYLEGESK